MRTAELTKVPGPESLSRATIRPPMTSRASPTLKGVKRNPEKRDGRVLRFIHLKVVLGGVSGKEVVKGSSRCLGRCHMVTGSEGRNGNATTWIGWKGAVGTRKM